MSGEGSDIMLLKLCSVLSLIALRNVGTKNIIGFIVYNSGCKGYKISKKLVSLGKDTATKNSSFTNEKNNYFGTNLNVSPKVTINIFLDILQTAGSQLCLNEGVVSTPGL